MTERGSVTVVALAVMVVALATTVALSDVVVLMTAHARATAAADAAALAAAPVTFRSFGAAGTPADEAARFAAANGARLVACRCFVDRSWNGRVVSVEVALPVELTVFPDVDLHATASAEFTPVEIAQ